MCDAGGSWVYFQVKLCVMQGVAGCTYSQVVCDAGGSWVYLQSSCV